MIICARATLRLARHLAYAATFLSATISRNVTAQTAVQSTDTLVPRELAIALLGATPTFDPIEELANARVLSSFPANLIPPNVIMVGGIRTHSLQTQIFLMRELPSQATASLNARFDALGWRLTQPYIPRQVRSGFVPAGLPAMNNEMSGVPRFRCKDNAQLLIRLQPEGGGYTEITATVASGERAVNCRRMSTELSGVRRDTYSQDDSLMPMLLPPMSSIVQSSGSSTGFSGGGASITSNASLQTSLATRELLDHYGVQILSAGWIKADETSSTSLAAQRWTKRVANGVELSGILTVFRKAGATDVYDLEFTLTSSQAGKR